MNDIVSRPMLDGNDLDAAIDRARAALAALLPAVHEGGTGHPEALAHARALLGALLDRRLAFASARMDERGADAVAPASAAAARLSRRQRPASAAARLSQQREQGRGPRWGWDKGALRRRLGPAE